MAFLETVSRLSYKDCLQWLERKLPVVHPAMLTALSVCLNATQESKFMPQKSQFNWESGRNLTLAQVASIVGVVLFSENKVEKNIFEKHPTVETLSMAEGGVHNPVRLINLVCYPRHHFMCPFVLKL